MNNKTTAQQYKNIHTGKVVTLARTEVIKGKRVYVFTDDDRWVENEFSKHWTLLDTTTKEQTQ